MNQLSRRGIAADRPIKPPPEDIIRPRNFRSGPFGVLDIAPNRMAGCARWASAGRRAGG